MANEALEQTKNALRKHMKEARSSLPQARHEALSSLAAELLLDSQLWHNADCVALYIAVRGETGTAPLLEAAWAQGKEVLLPLCDPAKNGLMRLTACPSQEHLVPGAYGIPEPKRHMTGSEPVPQLILTPGVAFDRKGIRLGMGGGYYDRLFAMPEYASATRVGYCFAFQVVPDLPEGAWDMRVHTLCTDEKFMEIRR